MKKNILTPRADYQKFSIVEFNHDDRLGGVVDDISDTIQDATDKMIAKMIEMREKILQERFDKLNIVIDIVEEYERRFPRLTAERYEDGFNRHIEVWYYDDGTKEGLRVVTFVESMRTFDIGNPTEFGYDISYY